MLKKESAPTKKVPWNRGKLVGQKLPLTQQQVWSIRMRLEAAEKVRDGAIESGH